MDLCTGMDADCITQGRVMDYPGWNPWAVLGLTEGASQAQIRRAFREQAKRTHPDAGGRADRFMAVKAAYDELCADTPTAVTTRAPRATPYDPWLAPMRHVRVWSESTPEPTTGSPSATSFREYLDAELARSSASAAA